MIEITAKPDPRFKAQMRMARDSSIRATEKAVDRMTTLVQLWAREAAPKNTSLLANSIVKTRTKYNRLTDQAEGRVVVGAPYGGLVESGFRGHFVPFHVSPSLYFEAIHKWGWRIPAPGTVKNPRTQRMYLIPRGRSRPVWGVYVHGAAQPYLAPAVDKLVLTGAYVRILEEEYRKEYAARAGAAG